jgi:hypothetical protein
MAAIDAVDGSSTGTRVPRIWGSFEAPTIRRSYLCSRFRQSVSISPSRFSSAWRRCGWPSGPTPAVEAPARLGIFPKTVAVPGGSTLVPRAAGAGAYGTADAAGLCEALRQDGRRTTPRTPRRFAKRSQGRTCGSCRPRRSSNRLSGASSCAPSLHPPADCGHQLNPRASCRARDRRPGRAQGRRATA